MKKILSLLLGITSLSACERIIGPIDAVLNVEKDMSLLTNKNRRWEPKAGEVSEVRFYYDTKTKTFYIKPDPRTDETVGFANATVNSSQTAIVSLPENSGRVSNGDKVGMESSRSVVCTEQPCDKVDTRRAYESCTYYVRQPVTYCRDLGHGRRQCWTEWRDYPVRGSQLVEYTDVTRTYAYNLRVYGKNSGDLAKSSTQREETSRSARALTPCR